MSEDPHIFLNCTSKRPQSSDSSFRKRPQSFNQSYSRSKEGNRLNSIITSNSRSCPNILDKLHQKQSIDEYWKKQYGDKCPYQRKVSSKHDAQELQISLTRKSRTDFPNRSLETIDNEYGNMKGIKGRNISPSFHAIYPAAPTVQAASEVYGILVKEKKRAQSALITRKIVRDRCPELPLRGKIDNHSKITQTQTLFRPSSASTTNKLYTIDNLRKLRPSSPYMKQLDVNGLYLNTDSSSSTVRPKANVNNRYQSSAVENGNEDRAVNLLRTYINTAVSECTFNSYGYINENNDSHSYNNQNFSNNHYNGHHNCQRLGIHEEQSLYILSREQQQLPNNQHNYHNNSSDNININLKNSEYENNNDKKNGNIYDSIDDIPYYGDSRNNSFCNQRSKNGSESVDSYNITRCT